MLRRGRSVVIAVALVPLAVVVAGLGAVVHPTTVQVLGVPLPVGMLIALVAETALLLAGGAALGSRWGAAIPALAWLITVLVCSLPRPEGDLLVAGNPAGYSFLLLGTVVAGLAVSIVPLVVMARG